MNRKKERKRKCELNRMRRKKEEETVRKWKKDLEQVGIVDFPGKEINGKERKWREKKESNRVYGAMQDLFLFQLQQEKRITHH